jgi:hypothetical protein
LDMLYTALKYNSRHGLKEQAFKTIKKWEIFKKNYFNF